MKDCVQCPDSSDRARHFKDLAVIVAIRAPLRDEDRAHYFQAAIDGCTDAAR